MKANQQTMTSKNIQPSVKKLSLTNLTTDKSGVFIRGDQSSKTVNTDNQPNNNLFFTEVQSQAPILNRNNNLE